MRTDLSTWRTAERTAWDELAIQNVKHNYRTDILYHFGVTRVCNPPFLTKCLLYTGIFNILHVYTVSLFVLCIQ